MCTELLSEKITQILHSDEESAAAAIFFRLLRRSAVLRDWLWEEFGQSEPTRVRFADYLDGKLAAPLPEGPKLLAWLAGEQAYLVERERLKREFAGQFTANVYGGLTREAVEVLIRRYQAGNRDYGAFFLLYAWRKHLARHTRYEMRLLRANQVFFAGLAGQRGKELGKQLLRAQAYFSNRDAPVLQRADYGFSDWWKISLLLYLLNHPKPRYRTGEFCRHLAAQRLTIDPKDVRVFCREHGIARDTRAGRPQRLP